MGERAQTGERAMTQSLGRCRDSGVGGSPQELASRYLDFSRSSGSMSWCYGEDDDSPAPHCLNGATEAMTVRRKDRKVPGVFNNHSEDFINTVKNVVMKKLRRMSGFDQDSQYEEESGRNLPQEKLPIANYYTESPKRPHTKLRQDSRKSSKKTEVKNLAGCEQTSEQNYKSHYTRPNDPQPSKLHSPLPSYNHEDCPEPPAHCHTNYGSGPVGPLEQSETSHTTPGSGLRAPPVHHLASHGSVQKAPPEPDNHHHTPPGYGSRAPPTPPGPPHKPSSSGPSSPQALHPRLVARSTLAALEKTYQCARERGETASLCMKTRRGRETLVFCSKDVTTKASSGITSREGRGRERGQVSNYKEGTGNRAQEKARSYRGGLVTRAQEEARNSRGGSVTRAQEEATRFSGGHFTDSYGVEDTLGGMRDYYYSMAGRTGQSEDGSVGSTEYYIGV